jgi:argininosuccinate synthase
MKKLAEQVTGVVRVKLFKGAMSIVGRKSDYSLYDFGLATYDRGDLFDHKASEGFIKLWGLPIRTQAMVRKKVKKGER